MALWVYPLEGWGGEEGVRGRVPLKGGGVRKRFCVQHHDGLSSFSCSIGASASRVSLPEVSGRKESLSGIWSLGTMMMRYPVHILY